MKGILIIGDMVGSRGLSPTDRYAAQELLQRVMCDLNDLASADILSPFTVLRGDEFMGLLDHSRYVPQIIRYVHSRFTYTPVRFGIGRGKIDFAINADLCLGVRGDIYRKAFKALKIAKDTGYNDGVFKGFGEHQKLLNELAKIRL